MMATRLYRIAAVVLVLFGMLHTVGFLSFQPPTAEGLAVRDAMNRVFFQVGNSSFSYGHFYRGFGLFVTLFLLFSGYLAWYLGGLARTNPMAIGALGWIFVAVQVISLVLDYLYFSLAPTAFSAVATVSLAWAAWIAGSRKSVV
jgi:hypothetical protein